MVPLTELLREHNLFRTSHLDEARSEVARVFCPHGLTTTNKDEKLNTVHNRVTLGDVTLNYLDYGAEVHITPGVIKFFLFNSNAPGWKRRNHMRKRENSLRCKYGIYPKSP